MLETSRMILVPLSHEQLLLYKNNPVALAENLGVRYLERQHDPTTMGDLTEALEFWISNTALHRERFEWFTNWEIIVKEEKLAIGGIGFAGWPNELGKSTVGYGLDIRFQGKGYATEALQALIPWAFQNPALQTIIADTPRKHIASHRVLIKNGFEETSRDEELIYWSRSRK